MVDIFAFEEWRQEQDKLVKAPAVGGRMAPISPYAAGAPIGPTGRTLAAKEPSVYSQLGRSQPDPWIDDVDEVTDFYSPMQPVWPFGPPNVQHPRTWDYPIGYNLNFIPQRLEFMHMLRGMRSSWGVLSTVIATRQDQLTRLPWTIQRRDHPQQSSKAIDELKKFFRRPDGQNHYRQWSNLITDDLLVLDAPAIYFFRDRGGKPIAATVMDGATIFPLIDDMGRRPGSNFVLDDAGAYYLKRQPAFQQIVKGLPQVNLDESELMYVPMRPRPNLPIFGYPATEQILIEASEAIRKTVYQLEFWAEGTIPDLIVTVPEAWSPRQIAMFQAHFDAFMSGNVKLKSKVRFLPGGMKPFDIKNSSGESLWSQRDETLIRLACYAYSVSPTPFVKQVNRSVAQNASDSAEQEGLYPLMGYWKDCIMDPIIQEKFGYDDIEFIFLPRPERDNEKQSKIYDTYVKSGILSRNEVRAEQGREPIPGGETYTIELGNIVVSVEDAAAGKAMPMSGGGPGTDPLNTPNGSSPDKSPKNQSEPVRGQPVPNHDAPVGKSLTLDEAAARASGDILTQSHRRIVAGNYPKGHIRVAGLDISIENAPGSMRGKRNDDGTLRWANRVTAPYGYIRGTIGADGDQVDVFVGPNYANAALGLVYVIDQGRLSSKGKVRFDEHKVMLGYENMRAALNDYRRTYGARSMVLSVTEATIPEFKLWLAQGKTHKPAEGRLGQTIRSTGLLAKADTISSSTGLLGRGKKRRKKRRHSGEYEIRTQ